MTTQTDDRPATLFAVTRRIRPHLQVTAPSNDPGPPLPFAEWAVTLRAASGVPAPHLRLFRRCRRASCPGPMDRLSPRAVQGGGGSSVRTPKLAIRSVRILAMPLLLAGAIAGVAPVTAAARARPAGPAASSTVSGDSPGCGCHFRQPAPGRSAAPSAPLALRPWPRTGTAQAWKQVPDPAPADSSLSGVAATSVSSAWAVGCSGCFTSSPKTLIMAWNGEAWKQVPSQAPADSSLSGVAATSASSAWAVAHRPSPAAPRH